MAGTKLVRKTPTIVGALLLVAVIFTAYSAQMASGSHQPADKVAAAGSDIDTVEGETLLLTETMRVASPTDLIIQLTAECSILTELTTGPSETAGASDNAFAYGSVRIWVEIDGTPVPISSADGAGGADDAEDDDDVVGEVTFCNRAYERTVTDGEEPRDGIDEEHDYIRTRTANAFNWIALDTGFVYDSPANGNNILQIDVYADFDTTTLGDAVAEAFVGSRTLVVEPVKLSVHESVDPTTESAPDSGKKPRS